MVDDFKVIMKDANDESHSVILILCSLFLFPSFFFEGKKKADVHKVADLDSSAKYYIKIQNKNL